MSLASWFTASPLHRASALNKPGSRPSRQPIHSRPSLEHLEERTLLDASSGLIGGASNNLNLNNNFSFASSGNVLPIPTNGFHAVTDNGLSDQAATADLPAQDQPVSQFRLFGINSQGDSSRFVQQSTTNILRDAYGFGSGTMPNAPWMPNAYNLGLANHQSGYPSQTDMGFSSVPPWIHRGYNQAARSLPRDQTPAQNQDQIRPLNLDEESAERPEQSAPMLHLPEQEQTPQDRMDKDTDDAKEDFKALTEPPASEKQSPLEAVAQEDGSIPDSLWLSTLAPAPMAALIAGLPGMTAATEGGEASGDVGGEAAE